jgi:hypothetical protein
VNAYNGHSGAQRAKAHRWLKKQWELGTPAKPSSCSACGLRHGIIDAHAEDYSLPFAAGKTDEFHLCFACHLIVHCRVKFSLAWKSYVFGISHGAQPKEFEKRNFPLFASMYLRLNSITWSVLPDVNVRRSTVLDVIDARHVPIPKTRSAALPKL